MPSNFTQNKAKFSKLLNLYIDQSGKLSKSDIKDLNDVFTLGMDLFGIIRPLPGDYPTFQQCAITNKTTVETPQRSIPATYAIMDLDDLITSHTPPTFKPDPRYPDKCQQRDYEGDKAEQEKVRVGALHFNPRIVINNAPTASDGAAIVNKKGFVLGGNGRTMMMKSLGNDKYQEYVSKLRCDIGIFGLSERDIDKHKKPVLVRIVSMEVNECALFSNILNQNLTQELDLVTKTVSFARQLSPADVSNIAKVFEDADSDTLASMLADRKVVKKLQEIFRGAGIITPQNTSKWLKDGDVFTQEGRIATEGILVGTVLDDKDLIESARSFTEKIVRTIPLLLRMKRLPKKWNLIDDIQTVIRLEYERRQTGDTIDDFIAQISFAKPEVKEKEELIWRILSENSWLKWKNFLDRYVKMGEDAVESESTGGGFFGETLEPMDAIRRLAKKQPTLSGYDDDKTRFEAILDLYISNANKFTASEINELNEVFELGKELFGSERVLPKFEEKTVIPVITEEDYLAINGASRQDFGDSALHKNKGNNSDKQWSKLVDAQAEKDRKLMEKRQELREEFQEKVENGELREPTRLERLVSTANGPYDTEARQAARAVLAKNGMQAKVLNPDQNEPIPDNIESENEDEITENYFMVNSERKLEVYFNYDKYKNLPEAEKKFIKSNFLWSRGKGAWISKASHPAQVQYLSNRLINELKLRSKGREKRMTFQEERDKERSKSEYKVQVYDRRAQSAEARGEALQSEFDKLRQDWSWLTQPVIRGHRGSEAFGKQRQRIIDRYSKGFQEFDKAKYYKAAKEYQENSLQNPELKNIDYIRKKIKEVEKLIKTYTGNLEVTQSKLKDPNRADREAVEDRMQRYMEELEYNYEKLAYYKLAEESLIENDPELRAELENKAEKKIVQKDEVLVVKAELKKYFKKIDPNITVSHGGNSIIAKLPWGKEDTLLTTRNSIKELFKLDSADRSTSILLSAKQWKLWMIAEGIIWDKTLSQDGAIKMARELKEAGKINTLSGLEESTPTYPTIPQSVADEIGQAFTRAGQMDFVRLMKNPAVANTVIQALKKHGIINAGNQTAWISDSTTLTDNGITILRESLWKTIFPNLGTSDFPVQVSDKVLKNLSSFLKIRQNPRIFQQFEIAVQIGNEFAGNDDTVMFDDPLDAQEFAFLCPFLYDAKNDKFEWVMKKYLDWNGKSDRKEFLESLSGEIGQKKQRQSTFGLSDQYVWR